MSTSPHNKQNKTKQTKQPAAAANKQTNKLETTNKKSTHAPALLPVVGERFPNSKYASRA